ncbi:hypothetical protein BC628DRAFT_1429535 [Trametes gibbosa]|nr:hypothetical protein BC628DRAFT_1429535 [Trametes gibbosa]
MAGFANLPPFPNDRDEVEIDKLWKAATELGFWYMKNHGVDAEVDKMFDMGAETMQLPLHEKMKYEQGDEGISFGYKAAGANATDEKGSLDTVEFINVAKDDALAWPAKCTRATPHREEPSGSEARCIKSPPRPGVMSEEKLPAIGAHTDFGSLSFLHNRLGGYSEWQYFRNVLPIPNHAICNLGDAMTIFSGGILRSNLHRVVPPPKEQGYTSVGPVFFTRPDTPPSYARCRGEPDYSEAVSKLPQAKYDTATTSKEWSQGASRIRGSRTERCILSHPIRAMSQR